MPLLEFACEACGHRFEELVGKGEAPTCPECGERDLRRQVSTFGVGGGRPEPMSEACGSCDEPGGPAACPWNQP